MYSFLSERDALENCIRNGKSPHCLPSNPDLYGIDIETAKDPLSILRAKKSLDELDYENIVIDTPPSVSAPLQFALLACDVCLVPVNPDRWILKGLAMLFKTLEKVNKSKDKQTKIIAIPSIVTKKEDEQIRETLADKIPMTKTTIMKAAAIKKALARGERLPDKTKAAQSFLDLAQEVRAL